MQKIVHTSDYPITDSRLRPTSIAHNASFFNFFYILSDSESFINSR